MTPTSDLPLCWQVCNAILSVATRILLCGPPGTGKTFAATLATRPGQRVYAVTLTEEMPAAELRGHYVPNGTRFEWQDGPAVTARYRTTGSRLVLNELDHASPDVHSLLHAVLDDDASSTLTLPTGETLTAASATQVVATMNGEPDDLPPALRDRFPVCILIDAVHPAAVNELPADLRVAAVNSALLLDSTRRISIRVWRAFAALRASVGDTLAAQACFGPRAEDCLDAIRIASAGSVV